MEKVIDEEFKYAMCMGSENYVCLRKTGMNSTSDLFVLNGKDDHARKVLEWIEETETGLLTDIDFVPDKAVWQMFSRESDLCFGRKCVHNKKCFFRNAREVQEKAHVLISNHSLLFAELLSEGRILPEFHGLVLDEAHTVEDIATKYFGKEISSFGLNYFIEKLNTLLLSKGLPKGIWDKIIGNKIEAERLLKKLKSESDVFFKQAADISGKNNGDVYFDRDVFFANKLTSVLADLSCSLTDITKGLKKHEIGEEFKRYIDRCDKYIESLNFIFSQDNELYVYWLNSKKGDKYTNYTFNTAPVDISNKMRTYIFESVSPVVLTSATLSSSLNNNAKFDFIKKRLGVDNAIELLLDSPFDYKNNVLAYVPSGIADPNKTPDLFVGDVQNSIVDIYDLMGGRIFALFTSYSMLNAVSDNITKQRNDISILKQGDLPRYVLLEVFKRNKNCILMGTMTFWQGVDVPGDSLECVIITKLPFAVPSDPITAARIKCIRDNGSNPFSEYQVPQAIITFKQGMGRLIRTRNDRGVIAVLDPRVGTRFYGKDFINAMPKCRKTNNINDIEKFFSLKTV